MNRLQKDIRDELDGHKAWQHANYITQWMRTPGSSGIKQTNQRARDALESYGLDRVYEIRYPSAEDGTQELAFTGWDVNDARLEVVEPESTLVTSYAEAPTCIQHWSIPTPSEGIVAELVDVGKGINESDYEGKELEGKIALASGDGHAEGNSQAYLLAVERHGAIGLVTDNLIYQQPPTRVRENHPDAIALLRVPSREEKGWAFTISYTQGTHLRALLKRCGEVTTSVALIIANAGPNEARYTAQVVEAKGRSRFMEISTRAFSEMTDGISLGSESDASLNKIIDHRKGEIEYQADRSMAALESVKVLSEDTGLHREIEEMKENLAREKDTVKERIGGCRAVLSGEV